MKPFILLITLIISLHASSLFAKAFHLLIMGDTQDPTLTKNVHTSMQNIEESFSYLASACNVPLMAKRLTMHDGTLTRKNIVKWVHKESVASDDVIILYFHGHGSRESGDERIWPRGYLLDDQNDTYSRNVDFSLIIEKLFSKRAALYLILLDCCNKGPQSPVPKNLFSESLNAFDLLRYKNQGIVVRGGQELFFKRYGFIIASGTSPGEVGYSWPPYSNLSPHEVGGVFTNIFLNNFFQALQSPRPEWQNIFMQTVDQCKVETDKKEKFYLTRQTPQYRLFLYKHRRSKRVYKRNLFKKCEVNPTFSKGVDLSFFSRIPEGEDTELNSDVDVVPIPFEGPEFDSEVIGDDDLVVIHEGSRCTSN